MSCPCGGSSTASRRWRRARRLLAASLAAVVAQAAVRVTDMLVRWDADDAQPSAEAGADT